MIKLYTMDNCVFCNIVKKRLEFEKIAYQEIKEWKVIAEKGFQTVPQLELPSGVTMNYAEAINWLNSQNWRADNEISNQ